MRLVSSLWSDDAGHGEGGLGENIHDISVALGHLHF